MVTRFHSRSLYQIILVVGLLGLFSIGCGSAASPAPTAAPAGAAAQPTAAPAQPTGAPAPTLAPAPYSTNDGQDSSFTPNVPAVLDRKIIKNAQLAFTVQDTPTAIFEITGIASDVGGYVVGSRTFAVGDRTGAQITIAVPVDTFEQALNMVRHVALHVDQDITSSSEVTEQYVDLESRLINLQATATRLRVFLGRAQTITETLSVNGELTRVEEQVEQIKGKLNALNARSALSTIAVDLSEPLPETAPTPTPTPIIWRPDETVQSAARLQTSLFQALLNVLIWFSVVLLPYLIAALLIGFGVRWVIRKTRNKSMT